MVHRRGDGVEAEVEAVLREEGEEFGEVVGIDIDLGHIPVVGASCVVEGDAGACVVVNRDFDFGFDALFGAELVGEAFGFLICIGAGVLLSDNAAHASVVFAVVDDEKLFHFVSPFDAPPM